MKAVLIALMGLMTVPAFASSSGCVDDSYKGKTFNVSFVEGPNGVKGSVMKVSFSGTDHKGTATVTSALSAACKKDVVCKKLAKPVSYDLNGCQVSISGYKFNINRADDQKDVLVFRATSDNRVVGVATAIQ